MSESDRSVPAVRRRPLRHLSFLIAAAAAVALLIAPAQASTSTKFYKVTFSQTAFASNQSGVPVAVTLVNCSSALCGAGSTQTLGSANVQIPDAFTVAAPALNTTQTVWVGTKRWDVKLAAGTEPGFSRVLEFRAFSSKDVLSPGQSVAASVTLNAPCGGGPYPTKSQAKQANNFSGPPGNDFLRVGADPVLTVSAPTVASIAFEQQPTTTQKNTAISPAVTVRVVDSCGNGMAGAPVGLAFEDDPSNGTAQLAGAQETTDGDGLATFGQLAVDTTGVGYTLVATSGALSSAESDAFNVVDFLCEEFPCVLEDPQNITSVVVNHPNRPLPGPLGLSVSEAGIPFGDENCGGETSLGRVVTILPDESVESDIVLEVTFRYGSQVVPSSGGVPHLRFCANDGPGTAWYEVFNCGKPAVPKCISKRNAAPGADVFITALMTWTDPEWSGFG